MIGEGDRPEDDGEPEQEHRDEHEDIDGPPFVVDHPQPVQLGGRLFSFTASAREVLLALLAPTMPSPDEGGVARDDAADPGADSEDRGSVGHADIVRLTRAEWMLLLLALILGVLSVGLAVGLIVHWLSTGLSTG